MVGAVRTFLLAIAASAASGAPILLGWWIRDLVTYFAHPVRTAVLVAWCASIFVFMLLKNRCQVELLGSQYSRAHWLARTLALLVTPGVCVLVLAVPPFSDRRELLVIGGDAVRYVGLFLAVAGAVLMRWAPLHLGRHFDGAVVIHEDHRLVTDGPYRLMRHPRYSGIIQWAFGHALAFRSVIGLVLAALVALGLAWRIVGEERLLARAFGDQWDRYRRRVSKLVPFVY